MDALDEISGTQNNTEDVEEIRYSMKQRGKHSEIDQKAHEQACVIRSGTLKRS